MIDFELLVGAETFWRRAAADCAAAKTRLLVQAMTFEGDAVGKIVAEAIGASPAADRRVLVDGYSRVMLSDRFVGGPRRWLAPELRAEAIATEAMFRRLIARGATVRVTNPVGPLWLNYPARNHKKLIVADDVAYLGGINFSDHNFAWRDFMLRIKGREAADFLAEDFMATFAGAPRRSEAHLGAVRLFCMDGRSNAVFFRRIASLIGAAQSEIVVLSAYLTFPLTKTLAAAARRGVRVRLITPWANNKPLVRDALLATARRAGFEVSLLAEMSHLKGVVIDGRQLVVGSSNFDFVSLAAEEELAAVITHPALIAAFRAQVIAPALAEALPADNGHRIGPVAGLAAQAALRLADVAANAARGSRRTAVDWA